MFSPVLSSLSHTGEIEQAMELQTYAQSVVCTQPTEIYVLDGKNYERLVQKRNPRTVEMLKMRAQTKLYFRLARSFDRTIPLVFALVHRVDEENRKRGRLTGRQVGFGEFALPSMLTVVAGTARGPTPAPEASAGAQIGAGLAAAISPQDSLPFASVVQMQRSSSPPVAPPRRAKTQVDFIPDWGPLIDIYGPGTVFYRNRQIREAQRLKAMRAAEERPGHSVDQPLSRSLTAAPATLFGTNGTYLTLTPTLSFS